MSPAIDVFRTSGSRALTGFVVGVSLVALVLVLVSDGVAALGHTAPWLIALGGATWITFWVPRIEITDEAVTVVNVFRTFEVEWDLIIAVETRWTLSLITPTMLVRSWAAPAPGRFAKVRAETRDHGSKQAAIGGLARPSDESTSESGAAALMVRARWLRWRTDTAVQGDRDNTVVVRWHYATMVLSVLVVLWCAAALLI